MNNKKLIKNLCEDELEKVSGGYDLMDYAKEHPFLTACMLVATVALPVCNIYMIRNLNKNK